MAGRFDGLTEFLGEASSMTSSSTMTRILRERHRPLWRRKGVLAAGGALVLAVGLGVAAWHLGGAVPLRTVTVALPDSEVGDDAASSGGIGG